MQKDNTSVQHFPLLNSSFLIYREAMPKKSAPHFQRSAFVPRKECANQQFQQSPDRPGKLHVPCRQSCPRTFVSVSDFACGLVDSCAGRIFFSFAGAVVCGSLVCPGDFCGSAVWPNAMSGNPNIIVNVSILIISPFPCTSHLLKRLDPEPDFTGLQSKK